MLRELKRPDLPFLSVIHTLVIFIAWGCWIHGAVAETFFVAPPPNGNDTNNCSSPATACATFQHGIDLCPVAHLCFILAAPGIYSQMTNVTHFRAVSISGAIDERGICINRDAVKVHSQLEGPIFWVQDHATLWIKCMRLEGSRSGNCGFMSRQFAIGDVDDVNFGAFPGSCAAGAEETSKINIENPGIYGNARLFANASDLSQVSVGGLVKLADGLKFDLAFLSSSSGSVISFYPTGIEGGAHFSGASYNCSDAFLKKTVVLPGGDVPYVATGDCRITGARSFRSEFDALAGKINDLQHNVERRLDIGFAAIVIIVLGLTAGAVYHRLSAIKK